MNRIVRESLKLRNNLAEKSFDDDLAFVDPGNRQPTHVHQNIIFLRLTRFLTSVDTDLVVAFMSKAAGISYPFTVEPK